MDKCFSVIHLCRIRATRLQETGEPAAGPHNVYVTDTPISLGVTPVIEAGQDLTLVSGCDCISASYRGTDKLKRFDLELDLATLEPGLLELLIGGSAILDAGDVIGLHFPTQLSCSDTQQPNVALEAWQDLWDGDAQAPSPNRFLRWIWPSTRWQLGAVTLANAFMQPKLTGFSRGNAQWGEGIFGDQPEAAEPGGSMWYDDAIPTAECGWQSYAVT